MPELATPVAPAAPAPAAPVAAPVAPAPPVAAPVTPAAPAVEAPVAPVPPSAAAAKYDPKTAATPPKAEDFPSTEQGVIDQIAANYEWEQSHPDELAKLKHDKAVAEGYAEADVPTEVPAEVPQPDAPVEEKPADAPAVAATPAAIDEWVGKSPELKVAFDKSPELRTAVMEMARQNEAAKPVLDIVGTVEEAKFAVEHANAMVSLQANWMLAPEGPEMTAAAWDQTVELFKERDANGNEVKGPDGKPKLADDFKPFVRKAATEAMSDFIAPLDSAIAQLETNLKGSYPNEQAREADKAKLKDAQYEKLAFDFVAKKLAGGDAGPQIPALPPGATEEQKAFQNQLIERQKALDEAQGKGKVTERKAARVTQDREVQTHYESNMLKQIDGKLAAMKERGEYLPDFVLNDKWINPNTNKVTGLTSFGVRIYQQLDAKIGNNPTHRAKLANLQALGNKDARIAELDRLQNLYLPGIIDAEVTRLQNDIRKGSKTPAPATPPIARVEPSSQGTVVPGAMSKDQARQWAESEVRKDPGYQSMSQVDREAAIIEKQFRKQFAG